MELLIVEDNLRIASSLKKGLREVGHTVVAVSTGKDAINKIGWRKPDLIILDLGLPDMDGLEILRFAKDKDSKLPVIILTARDTVEERVMGLDSGADDYLVKPFAFPELAARIRAIERRETSGSDSVIVFKDLRIDPLSRTVRRSDQLIDLTPREFDILMCLANRAGYAVTREMLASDALGIVTHLVAYDNIIDVHISHLRKKIDADSPAKLLHTVRGVGYKLDSHK